MKSKCILINKTGGSNVLEYTNVELNELGSNDVLIKHKAIGVNYIDIYHRTGVNPVDLPFIPGLEGSGEVLEEFFFDKINGFRIIKHNYQQKADRSFG